MLTHLFLGSRVLFLLQAPGLGAEPSAIPVTTSSVTLKRYSTNFSDFPPSLRRAQQVSFLARQAHTLGRIKEGPVMAADNAACKA